MKNRPEVALRITLVDPPAGVLFALQRGKDQPVAQTRASGPELSFDFHVEVGGAADGEPVFYGPFTQGPPDGRFVYVNSGTYAGDTASEWGRRAKVPLGGLTGSLIAETLQTPESFLEARISGKSRDGGAVCASVPLLPPGWRVVPPANR
jgi:hypothetical protein